MQAAALSRYRPHADSCDQEQGRDRGRVASCFFLISLVSSPKPPGSGQVELTPIHILIRKSDLYPTGSLPIGGLRVSKNHDILG